MKTRRTGSALHIVIVGLIAAAVIGFGLYTFLTMQTPKRLPPRATETAAEKYAEASSAFSDEAKAMLESAAAKQNKPAKVPTEAQFVALITKQRDAVRNEDGAAYVGTINVERLFLEVDRMGILPTPTARQRHEAVGGLRQGLAESVRHQSEMFDWETIEVHRIFPMERSGEAVVYYRLVDRDGYYSKMRGWLTDHSGSWKIYDAEDLDIGQRTSTMLATAMAAVLNNSQPPRWLMQVQPLMATIQIFSDGDLETAERNLNRLALAGFPDHFESLRLTTVAAVNIAKGNTAAARAALDQATRLNPDAPMCVYLDATLSNAEGNYEHAIDAAQQYLDLLGPDDGAWVEIGVAQANLQRYDDAVNTFEKALEEFPNSIDAMVELASIVHLTDRGAAPVVERFAAMTVPGQWMDSIAAQLWRAENFETLELLVAELRRLEPNNAHADYWGAQVLANDNRIDEALAMLEQGMQRAPITERASYEQGKWDLLIRADRPLEAYENASDKRAAFAYIADVLFWNDDNDSALRELCTAHGKMHPNDGWMHYYLGELAWSQQRTREAAMHYQTAVDNAANENEATTFRNSLIFALFADGQIEAAYRQPGNVRQRMKEFTSAAASEKDAAALKRLIAVHETSDSADPALPFYRGVLHWVHGDYDTAMQTLRTVSGHLRTADQLGPWWESLMLRSLLRTDQHQEALRMATLSTARDEDPYFEVIVYAVMGNVEATTSAMQTCIDQGYLPDTFYDDDDAGTALEADAFTPLREQFPSYGTEAYAQQSP